MSKISVKLIVVPVRKTVNVEKGTTLGELLDSKNVDIYDDWAVMLNGKLTTDFDEVLRDGDIITVARNITGGC